MYTCMQTNITCIDTSFEMDLRSASPNSPVNLERELRQTFEVPEEIECRVWRRISLSTHGYELLTTPHGPRTLSEARLHRRQVRNLHLQ